ncbi:hypothetical protein ACMD2_23679 [Ananas comosus]|uniref:Uncharacterized protein n=1 Tax=Ananas comosus TaxID=4615 RepID=A0A199WAZ0_ANACO|nr:hypothetical protein ACMD2_23679 [Ananas comosus]
MVSGVRTTRKFPVGSATDLADSPTRSIQAYVGKKSNTDSNQLYMFNNHSLTLSQISGGNATCTLEPNKCEYDLIPL